MAEISGVRMGCELGVAGLPGRDAFICGPDSLTTQMAREAGLATSVHFLSTRSTPTVFPH